LERRFPRDVVATTALRFDVGATSSIRTIARANQHVVRYSRYINLKLSRHITCHLATVSIANHNDINPRPPQIKI
jgi:hypothetical protein